MTTLPLDLDIFLRSGSRIQPDRAAWRHGSASCSKWARTTVENSQVRMMSWACGRRSIGKTRWNRSSSSTQPPAIWGVSDDVAQVSMMSGSPTKPPGWPRWASSYPGGTSEVGSTGRASSSGTSTVSKSVSPSASTAYQTGMGTPK